MSPSVLTVVLTRQFAGTERHVVALNSALRVAGWRTTVAASSAADANVLDAYRGVADVELLPDLPVPVLVPRLALLARRCGADVLHAHMGNATAVAVAAGRLSQVPVVATVHFLALAHQTRRAAWAQRRVYDILMSRTTAIIAVSHAVRGMILERGWLPAARVHVVHNGIEPEGTAPPTNSWSGEGALYCGRLEHEKGLESLLRALAPHPAVRLTIVGRGSMEPRLRAFAQEVMPDRAHFAGFVADPTSLMRAARVVVMPSLAEGFGIVAVEAMREARAVVGFRVGGLPEVVVDGLTGRLVEPGDEAALGHAVAAVATDADLARRLGTAGRARYLEKFTAQRMAEETAAVYRAAMARAGSGAAS